MKTKRLALYLGIAILSSTAMTNTFAYLASIDWTGAYVGAYLGGAAGTNVSTTEPIRLDNNAYWFRPYHNSFSYNTSASFIGGATIGYNWQIGKTPWLLGLEGEYGFLSEHGSSVDPNQYPYAAIPGNGLTNSSRSSMNIGDPYGYAFLGGRVGYAVDRALIYIKSGAVFTKNQSEYDSVKTEDSALAYLHISGSNNITGYGLGAGIEYALTFLSNVSIKAEYLYLGIDNSQYANGHCSCSFLWRTTEHITGIHTAKIGLNYKFS